ncbi:hypothetical protein X734_21320 [Mesorhizobium sp. L2C084A000]|nr:hypothetical protein X734_21320 [Mesorhizobium sp. L2C084A000]
MEMFEPNECADSETGFTPWTGLAVMFPTMSARGAIL